jgi:hypothetical protein
MNQSLEKKLHELLAHLSDDWKTSIELVTMKLGEEEVRNRLQYYPKLCSLLSCPVIDIDQFGKAARACWALGGRYDLIRFGDFTSKGAQSSTAIQQLIFHFPEDDTEAIKRINTFIDHAVHLGYSKPTGSADRAGAALLGSVILTSLFPSRFVDFRQSRWNKFAEEFGYDHPQYENYGEKLIWAGKFAIDFSKTKTFQQYWPESESLWIISGLCWTGTTPPKPELEPTDIEEIESFPEGAEKRRMHLIRERNQAVRKKAKELGLKHDPMLRCQVCGFSFIEKYGEHGRGFIEAHHTQPIASLKSGSRTRVEDIALICGNCHRMVHHGNRTLTIYELRNMLNKQQ